MKNIIIFIFLSISSQLQAQINLFVGDSQLKGLAGVEVQYNDFSLSIGYRPAMCFPDHLVQSYSCAATVYQQVKRHNIYLSVGIASEGMTRYISGKPVSYPSFLAMTGTRINLHKVFPRVSSRWKTDAGIGVNCVKGYGRLTFEILVNFTLIK